MFKRAKRVEAGLFLRIWRREPEGKLERAGWRLLLLWLSSVGLSSVLPGNLGGLFAVLAWLFGIPLAWCVCGLALRFILQRVLWTVRSRLIVTCLLMGLAPIVLFLMLSGIAGYVFCGQVRDQPGNRRDEGWRVGDAGSQPGGAGAGCGRAACERRRD